MSCNAASDSRKPVKMQSARQKEREENHEKENFIHTHNGSHRNGCLFCWKKCTEQPTQPENINLERIEMTEQYGGIWLDYTDGNNFYSFYLTSEDLENVGYIKESITPENQEITDLTVTEHGLMVTFADDTGVWIESENLEYAGLINTANIIDWNTDGEELAVITENDYEYYAYKSENIYQNQAFIPVESVTE